MSVENFPTNVSTSFQIEKSSFLTSEAVMSEVLERTYVSTSTIVSYYLWMIASPTIIILGIFGNVMILVIMGRMTSSGESSVTTYFTALAVTDLVILLTVSLWAWASQFLGLKLIELHGVVCKLMTFVSALITAAGPWILVSMTLHRAVCVVLPHRAHLICSRRRVHVLLAAIFLTLSLFYSQVFITFDVVHFGEEKSCMPSDPAYSDVMKVNMTVNMFLVSLLPSVCLLTGNVLLVVRLSTSLRVQTAAKLDERAIVSSHQNLARLKTANSVTLTVVVVSLAFVVMTLPNAVYLALFVSPLTEQPQLFVSAESAGDVYLFYTVSYLLVDLNSAVNFYLYCLTGRRFRQEFIKILACVKD